MTPRQAHIAALRLPLDQLPDPLPIPVIERPFDVTIRPPGSKSITNRALLLAALADGTSELRGALIDADDAQVMLRAIQQLGAKVEIQRARSASEGGEGGLDIVRITGVNGRWKIPAGQTITLNLNNAGTATRFLTAAAILAPSDSGGIIIDGDARMRERPIGELIEALSQIGVRGTYLGSHGFPPTKVWPRTRTPDWSEIKLGRTASSQFVSALLLVMPFCGDFCGIRISEPLTSESYVDMTLNLLRTVGCRVSGSIAPGNTITAAGPDTVEGLVSFTLDIEPDASGATYFEAAAALIPTARVCIQALDVSPRGTLQGDSYFIRVLTAFHATVQRAGGIVVRGNDQLHSVDCDLSDMPDTAMTAAAIACFASPPHPTPDNPTATTTLRGLRTLRVKETDRLAALQTELSKLGAKVDIFKDNDDEGLRITPPASHTPPLRHSATPPLPLFFDTYNDHRMAMALALIGLRRPNVFIRNPACVAKTYPTFWQDLARLYA